MPKTFAKRIYEEMGKKVPPSQTGVTINEKTYYHIYNDEKYKKYNFIDHQCPVKCDIKGTLFGEDKMIKYHKGCLHLNSSQVMCINFFKEKYIDIL